MSWLKKLLGLSDSGPAGTGESVPGSGSLTGERVLVADSSMAIRKVIELTLEGEGCSVTFAASGDEAIASVAAAPPTVVIASTDLPGKNGLEVCEAIRRRPDLAGTIVLISTGAFEERLDQSRLRMAGSDGVLTKPFQPAELIDQLRTLRRKRPVT